MTHKEFTNVINLSRNSFIQVSMELLGNYPKIIVEEMPSILYSPEIYDFIVATHSKIDVHGEEAFFVGGSWVKIRKFKINQ